jgi:hypothetical protein
MAMDLISLISLAEDGPSIASIIRAGHEISAVVGYFSSEMSHG